MVKDDPRSWGGGSSSSHWTTSRRDIDGEDDDENDDPTTTSNNNDRSSSSSSSSSNNSTSNSNTNNRNESTTRSFLQDVITMRQALLVQRLQEQQNLPWHFPNHRFVPGSIGTHTLTTLWLSAITRAKWSVNAGLWAFIHRLYIP